MKIKVNFKGLLMLLSLIAFSNFSYAQRTITGTITDGDSNDPLVGASVVVTGTTNGTLTDLDGKYSLVLPADAKSITISFTGFEPITQPLGSENVLDFKMKAGSLLDEVVVVGYGSVRKVDATGAVNSITEKDFNRGVINSPEQLMQGRVAGVQVSQSSGEPGGGINVRIRGTSSVRSGNNPLFVIDGVPLSGDETSSGGGNTSLGSSSSKNPLSFMNPNDIASIDILKDASATAIYGSRGANGVVLITTKSGKSGKGTLEYGYDLGISSITKKYDLLSAEAFKAAKPANNLGATTDWQDEIFRTGYTHNHNLAFSAGDAQGSYRFSLGYLNQDGIVKNSNVKRYNARFNADRKFLDNKLKVGIQLTVSNNVDNGVPITNNAGYRGDLLGTTLKSNPTLSVYKSGTDTLNQPGVDEPNPIALLTYSRDITNTLRSLGNINAEYQIIDGLSFKTVVGFDRSLSTRRAGYSSLLKVAGIEGAGILTTNDINTNNTLWENYFNYNKKFGSVGFSGLLGYSYQRFDYATIGTIYRGFRESNLDLMFNNISSVNAKTGSIVPINSSNPIDELQSFFGRVNFNISEKYVVTATLRADGSTKFGGNNQYGYFPSFAAKWRLIEEDFIPKNLFSDLGLRVGYGVTGNQEIPHNLYAARGRYGNWTINDSGDKNDGSFGNVAFPNPNLKWEQTSAINVGLDFGFFNNRLSGSIEVYDKSTTGLLIQQVAAQPAVNDFVWNNLDAIVKNQGIELQLNATPVKGKSFAWNVSGNIAYNKNKITGLGSNLIQTGEINGQGLSQAFAQVIADEQPLFSYYLRTFTGFDKDGNRQLYQDGKDYQELVGKSGLPSVTLGITNGFSYKGLDLSFVFNGVFGNYIYNNTANAYFTAGALDAGRNVTTNVVTNGEGPSTAPDVSTRFLEDGSFIRLQNLSLSYNIQTGSSKISNLRVFVNGQNLWLSTNYSGQDPEVNTNKTINGVPSFGIDYSAYPRARTWTIGANISF